MLLLQSPGGSRIPALHFCLIISTVQLCGSVKRLGVYLAPILFVCISQNKTADALR